MATNLQTRILMLNDKDQIMAYERLRLETEVSDMMEREMRAWDARWRGEALEHYLPQGWSFGVYQQQKLVGYFLGQPYLFHRGLTQTLWIEHLAFDDLAIAKELIETAHRWARDKHLQTVLLENSPHSKFILQEFPKATLAHEGLIEFKSARF